jgi:hypothetical protein
MVKCTDFWHRVVFLFLLFISVTVALASAIFGLLTLIEDRRDQDPYLPVVRWVVGALELSVVPLAVVAMLCGGCGLLMGGKYPVLIYVLLHVGIAALQVIFTSVYIGFSYAPSQIPTYEKNLLMKYIESPDIVPMDRIQLDESCCGVHNYEDWKTMNTTWSRYNPDLLAPPSCCSLKDPTENCTQSIDNIFTQGCLKPVIHVIQSSTLRVAISNAILVVIQVPAIVLAAQVYHTLAKHSQYDVL